MAAPSESDGALGERYALTCYRKSTSARYVAKKDEFESYEDQIEAIGDFDNLRDFWSVYSFVMRPNDATTAVDLQLFRSSVRPMWEHPANRDGGRLLLRLRKGLASRYWEDTIFAFIGEAFSAHAHITGIVMSCKPSDDALSIWTDDANDKDSIASIKEDLVALLKLPPRTRIDYRKHGVSVNKVQRKTGSSRH
eukprot:Amastigsp_a339675_213.p1 type:complete len:194 gc:universal Amastigsp_a339675_213:683-102(-)